MTAMRLTTGGTMLAALLCVFVLMQCYVNNRAYEESCQKTSMAGSLNFYNACAALITLCVLLWNLRPTDSANVEALNS